MAVWQTRDRVPGSLPLPTLFLDRDGVVIRDRNYLADPADVELLPGVAKAMARARAAGWQLIGVSNQSGLGRGYFSAADFGAVMTRLAEELAEEKACFDGFFYCPHAPEAECQCRKPRLGMLTEAARDFDWDPRRSWVIGDKACDVDLGQNAGIGSILVRTGYGAEQEPAVTRRWAGTDRVLVATDLLDAVGQLLVRPEMSAEGGRT